MIIIASSQEYCNKIKEDLFIKKYVESKKHYKCVILPWKNLYKYTSTQDTVILKSIWGYHKEYKLFLKTIQTLSHNNIKLINDYKFIFGNIDKSVYLDIIKKQIDIINFISFKFINFVNFNQFLKYIKNTFVINGVNKYVIKPSISESGDNIYIINTLFDLKNIFLKLRNDKNVYLMQPLVEEAKNGEYSVIIINGIILYGIIRFPGIIFQKKGSKYISLKMLDKNIIKDSYNLVNLINSIFQQIPVIMRLDFIKIRDNYKLLELELIDPDLFLKYVPLNIRNKVLLSITDKI